jgi:hypothetical protein
MFEHYRRPLLPLREFIWRVVRHGVFALLLVAIALGIGVLGYHGLENLPWVDALVNAAMILGGMGPVDALHTTGGKVFAAVYALFSGLGFIVIIGVLFAPFIHRFLHRFHMEADDNKQGRVDADPKDD